MTDMSPEVAAQLQEQKKSCVFCRIISGQMQGKKVYDDPLIQGILDINPWTKGHVLMMPKEHYPIMPLLPQGIFRHMFSRLPGLVKSLKAAMLTTGAIVLIANGAVAGQQSPHFIIHLLPREMGDGLDRYEFSTKRTIDDERAESTVKMLGHNIPLMMESHFRESPAGWHDGNIKTPGYLDDISGKRIYQDEKSLVVLPEKSICNGHMQIFSTEEEKEFERVGDESSIHLFRVASTAATAVFEGLGAQGSNIILKTGTSNDNPDGLLSIHVIPRMQDDGIDVICPPMQNKPNLDDIQKKLKERFFEVEYEEKHVEREVIDLDNQQPEIIRGREYNMGDERSPADEITEAIERVRRS